MSRDPDPERSPHAVDAEALRRAGYRMVDLVVEHLTGLPERPVFQRMTDDERARIEDAPLPETGAPPDAIIDDIARDVLPHPMGNGHPRFFGWVNSAPNPLAALSEMIAAAMNPSCAGGDHAGVYVERCVVRWLRELLGYDVEGGGGLLVSGGSAATLTGLAAARQWATERLGGDGRRRGLAALSERLTLYAGAEVHSCVRKAVELLGLGSDNLRVVPVDDGFRVDAAALERAIAEDRARGLAPFCVVGSAGTVNTGAVDPLDRLADLCARESLWLHVDGAYGALGVLDPDPETRGRFTGLARVDSLAIDPHKWLAAPVECGCVLVRDAESLRRAFRHVPAYLAMAPRPGRGFDHRPWFSEYGFQQTRGFRALKLWVTLRQLGREGVARTVARHNQLARRLAAAIDGSPTLERVAPAPLSIVCFRARPPGLSGARLDAFNQELVLDLQEAGDVFVTGTTIGGRPVVRACVLNHRTTAADIDRLVDVLHARVAAAA